VIKSDKKLGGYLFGIKAKRLLLDLEKEISQRLARHMQFNPTEKRNKVV
jgi:hypothetical protein